MYFVGCESKREFAIKKKTRRGSSSLEAMGLGKEAVKISQMLSSIKF